MKSKVPAYQPRRGFTLIEILIVVTIIAVLAAITFSTSSRMIAAAKNTTSMSNLRSIGVGLTVASSDNSGVYPYGIADWYAKTWWDDVTATQGRKTSWGEKAGESFQSPLRIIKRNGGYPTYGGNPLILVDGPNGKRTPPRVAQINRPEEVIIVTDATQNGGKGDWGEAATMVLWGIPGLDWGQSESNANRYIGTGSNEDNGSASIRYRYKDSANCLFIDGSVSIKKRGTIRQKNLCFAY